MKRLLLPALMLLGAIHAVPSRAAMDRAVFVGLGASVLRIEAPGRRGGYAIGSGVAVGRDKVITNCHVTGDALGIFVVRGGVRWAATAQASDIERDLCLLQVPGLQAPAAVLGQSDRLAVGQTVTALGYTGGMGIQNSAGEVVHLHRHGGARVIQSNNWFSSGASGGGLFDADGRLVGILTFRLRGGAAHYFATPAEWVGQMLADATAGDFKPVRPSASRQLHYWQDGSASQPPFLKAAALLRDARWVELETVAGDWSRSQPRDAEAWALLGTALARQGRLQEAHDALECSRRLDAEGAAARAGPAAPRVWEPHASPPDAPRAAMCRAESR